MQRLTIGKLARAGDVGVETVRFYEKTGLLDEPPRSSSGYRQYPPEAVSRLRFIRRAKAVGFSLSEIKELLELRASRQNAGSVKAVAEARIDEIDLRLVELKEMRRLLERLTAKCNAEGSVSQCAILAALDGTQSCGPRQAVIDG